MGNLQNPDNQRKCFTWTHGVSKRRRIALPNVYVFLQVWEPISPETCKKTIKTKETKATGSQTLIKNEKKTTKTNPQQNRTSPGFGMAIFCCGFGFLGYFRFLSGFVSM